MEPVVESSAQRTWAILEFLFKYRNAGIFTGLDFERLATDGRLTEVEEGVPEAFAEDLEKLGPTFIKLGQLLSTRPDMVPAAYIEALEHMQDKVTPFPAAEVKELIEEELGVRINKLFAVFEETPIGAASLAQVHRAELRSGKEVAIKVQRPGMRERIMADLDILAGFARKADQFTSLGQRLQFSDWIQEFRKTLLAELDYRSEAENLERFAEHLADYPEIYVPKPLWDYTSAKVLTMDYVAGVKVTELGGLRRTENRYDLLAAAIIKGYFDQVFVHGQIHADPHPGNLLVTADNRLALLDLGMVAYIAPKQREGLLKLMFASVDGRGEEVANEIIAMSVRLEDFNEQEYMRDVGQVVARYAAGRSGQTASTGRLVLDLTRIGTACGLRTPPELTLLGKTLLNLDSVSTALEPELDVKQIVGDHLEQIMRKRLKQSFSPSNLASEFIEIQGLIREAPRKLSVLLSLLAENKVQIRMTGINENYLIENMQKIANRISIGLIIAALIVASAMIMHIETEQRLFGYPALAFILFLVAAVLGFALVLSALIWDRKPKPKEEHGPR
ncbi:MAG: AarF/UbiB family protein [bacterium]|nr:AarF/UbiB family protein [bacterium]